MHGNAWVVFCIKNSQKQATADDATSLLVISEGIPFQACVYIALIPSLHQMRGKRSNIAPVLTDPAGNDEGETVMSSIKLLV